jgi:hypothetical protein
LIVLLRVPIQEEHLVEPWAAGEHVVDGVV